MVQYRAKLVLNVNRKLYVLYQTTWCLMILSDQLIQVTQLQ